MAKTDNTSQAKPITDWPTAAAIAAVAISITQFLHEGVHALTCFLVGGGLQEFSTLHVVCENAEPWQSKIVSGSAAIVNVIVGLMLLFVLRRSAQRTPQSQFFLWLLMLMNWLVGAGYWMFSGIANIGDWANVIKDWQPHVLWRGGMTLAGTAMYTFFIWLALKEFGKIVGGDDPKEQIGRASKLGIITYLTIFLVILLTGLFHSYGITGLPAVAALLLALGGMSPLLWMMQWFRAESFKKVPKEPLAIRRKWTWILGAGLAVLAYIGLLS